VNRPLEVLLVLVGCALWVVGWITCVILLVRDELDLRREDPDRRSRFFPLWTFVTGAFLFWWADLYGRVRDRSRRRRKGP